MAFATEFTQPFAQLGAAALEDPLSFFIRVSRKLGAACLVGGTAMGVAAYYAKAASTTAMNNEMNVIGNIGTIFSNIKAPTFQPAATGTAPLSWSVQGVQNFFGDAWQDVGAAASDVAQIGAAMGTLAEDLATAVIDVAKSVLAFVMHFPDILWNGVVWGIGGAIADVLTWAFPWFLIIGGALIIASLIAQGIRSLWDSTVGAAAKEAWAEKSAELKDRARASFDKLLRNRVHESPAPDPDVRRESATEVPAPQEIPASPEPEIRAEEVPEAPEPQPGPAEAPAEASPQEKPIGEGWTEAEMEDYLGKAREAERDAARAAAAD